MGWFGPDGDCGCCEGCPDAACSNLGTPSTVPMTYMEVVLTSLPASPTFWIPGGATVEKIMITSGFGAHFNGTWNFDRNPDCSNPLIQTAFQSFSATAEVYNSPLFNGCPDGSPMSTSIGFIEIRFRISSYPSGGNIFIEFGFERNLGAGVFQYIGSSTINQSTLNTCTQVTFPITNMPGGIVNAACSGNLTTWPGHTLTPRT